jgi:hypothetical protein
MPLPTKNFLYFITDKANRSKYVENGVIKTSSPPVPLPQHPKGWKDIQISFGTNSKYFSLNRSFTVPMFFVGDGAIICRDAVYKQKGYQEELYIVILKLNPQTGIYELEYKGRLDFGKFSDEPRKGITINSIEGGVLMYLAANDTVQYEIPLDSTNSDCIQILFQGVNLYDRYRYSEIQIDIPKLTDYDHNTVAYTIPIVFISNEGDSVGIVQGPQEYQEIAYSGAWTNSMIDLYCKGDATHAASYNTPFYSIHPITIKNITGNILFTVNQAGGNFGVWILLETSKGTRYNILGTPGSYVQYSSPQSVTVPISLLNIPLDANEKVFIIAVTSSTSVSSQSVTWQAADIFFEFNSVNPASKAYALPPLQLWKALVNKMTTPQGATTGLYTGDSAYFAANPNVVWTSTNAIRNFSYNYYFGTFDCINTSGIYTIKIPGTLANFPDGSELIISGAASNNGGYIVVGTSLSTPGYTIITVVQPLTTATITGQISSGAVIKLSVEEFYKDVDCDKPMCLIPRGNVLWIEPIESFYNASTQILDIGEITDLKLSYMYEWLCNTATFGSKSQDYRQRNGRLEFNTTTLFQLPVDTLKRDYTKITRSRRDCFGIEFIRSLIFDKPTTDSTGDNQPFMVDVLKGVTYIFYSGAFSTVINTGQYYINILVPVIGLALNVGDIIVISGAASNNGTYTVENVSFLTGYMSIRVTQPVTAANLTGVITTTSNIMYRVNQPAYSSITGVLDNTVFNTTITPHHQLKNHGRILNGILYQLPTSKILFRTADKNGDLVTTLASVTLAEKQDEVVSDLGTPIFYPLSAQFLTPVPINFATALAAANNGYIKGTYWGVPLYFIPIGKMDSKPATNEPQQWEMVLAGPDKNDINTINLLSLDSDYDMVTNGISISFLNSLHWVQYNYALPAKYTHLFMDQDWQVNRVPEYVYRPSYFQKWQTTESIPVQAQTKGLGLLAITWYDSNGKSYATGNFTITSDPAVITPNQRQDYLQDISSFSEGYYFAVISDGSNKLAICEPIYVKAKHEGTALLEYNHSTNKYKYYFTGVPALNIRIDATLLEATPDSTFTDYQDEVADTEVIDGIPVMKYVLNTYPWPSWLARKVNMILLLNQVYFEGQQISRTPDSKFAATPLEGSPLAIYNIDVMDTHQKYALTVNSSGGTGGIIAAATLSAQAFGNDTPNATIDIETPVNP